MGDTNAAQCCVYAVGMARLQFTNTKTQCRKRFLGTLVKTSNKLLSSSYVYSVLLALTSPFAVAQVNIQVPGSSVKVDASGVAITAPGVSVNAGTNATANSKNAARAVASTGGKCVNGTLSVKTGGVGDRKLGDLVCDLVVLENAAVGDLKVGSVKAKEMRVMVTGTGNVVIGSGSVDAASYSIAGTGDIIASGVKATSASVAIAGVGNAQVHADKALSTSISGTGDVLYKGTPSLSSNTSGIGSVRNM
jgi:Putative auto-transporter adhesin, head GIN domain